MPTVEKICKLVGWATVSIMLILSINNCKLDAVVIEKCRTACSGHFSRMQEVTPRKCVCAYDSESEWVIPR